MPTINFNGSDGILVVMRHGTKDDARYKPYKPGGEVDKTCVGITAESASEIASLGHLLLNGEHITTSLAYHSDFKRTRDTARTFLYGDSPALSSTTVYEERMGIGVGIPGIDWEDPRLPAFGYVQEVQDVFIQEMYQNFYFHKEDVLPRLSFFGAQFTQTLVDGIRKVQGVGQGKGLVTIVTHGTIIDTLPLLVADYLMINHHQRHVQLDKSRFPGSVLQGEYFVGRLTNLRTENPALEVSIKIRDNPEFSRGFRLSDLERKAQEFAADAAPR